MRKITERLFSLTKQTTLALACVGLPVVAFALQPLADNQLSQVTGQDGITLSINTSGLSWDQVIYDRDGVPDDGNGNAKVLGVNTSLKPGTEGALVMGGLGITPGGTITMLVDAGSSSVGPVLNINVSIPDGTTLHVGDLQLGVPSTVGGWALDTTKTETILSAGTTADPGINIEFGATNLNIQLGNVAQTLTIGSQTFNPMMLTDLTIKKGVHIENATITDVSDPNSTTYDACLNGTTKVACSQTIDDIYVNDNDGTLASTKTSDLTVKGLGMNVTTNGIAFAVNQLGYRDGTGVDHGINIQMDGIHLGGSDVPGLGNAYIQGLQLGQDAVLTISGH